MTKLLGTKARATLELPLLCLAMLLLTTPCLNAQSPQLLRRATAQPAHKVANAQAETDQKEHGGDADEDHQEVLKLLRTVQQAIENFRSKAPDQPVPERLNQELELLKWLDLLYSNRAANEQRKTELQEELKRTVEQTEAMRAAATGESEPCSFLMLDEVRDQLHTEQGRQDSIQLEIEAAKSSLNASQQAFEESESERRLAREVADRSRDSAAREATEREYRLAKLRSRAMREAVRQRQLELEVNQLEQQISIHRSEFLREQMSQMQHCVKFSTQDLEAKLAAVDKAEDGVRRELADAMERLGELERQWLASQRDLEKSTEQDPVRVEAAAMWRMLRDLNQEHISVLQRVIGYTGVARLCWRQRYDLANGRTVADELPQKKEKLDEFRTEVTNFKRLLEIRADERMGDLATMRRRLFGMEDAKAEVSRLVQHQADELERAINTYGSQLVLIKTAERLLDRYAEELDQAIEPDTAREWLARTRQVWQACWDYEITSVDDRPITVSKVVWGTFLLFLGFCVARVSSRILGRRLLPRLGLNQGAAVAFQSIAFYLMLTCFGFLSLEVINLPLTVFAFMGGAVAIGVGFGSQNVLNNFISGLIMLAERPIRVGDLVDIDGLNGTIEHIGARSTRVKTGSNLEIIVPNSKFLENNVTNWTLSDTRIRTLVSVGVAYGSPTEDVCRLLRQAVVQHPQVIQKPEPIVLFKEFGDNSLLFEAHFWIQMRTVMEGERIASDVRLALDQLFDEANITIAFPQRDIHLDTLKPIEVNVRQVPESIHSAFGPASKAA